MSPDPRKATPMQQAISAGVLIAQLVVPVLCWFAIDHRPWWQFVAVTFLYSAVGWFVGAVALTIIFHVNPIAEGDDDPEDPDDPEFRP